MAERLWLICQLVWAVVLCTAVLIGVFAMLIGLVLWFAALWASR